MLEFVDSILMQSFLRLQNSGRFRCQEAFMLSTFIVLLRGSHQ